MLILTKTEPIWRFDMATKNVSTKPSIISSVLDLQAHKHLVIVGATGAGKTTFIRQSLAALSQSGSDFKVMLADYKGDLANCIHSQHLVDHPLAIASDALQDQLAWLKQEMENRFSGGHTETPLILVVDGCSLNAATLKALGQLASKAHEVDIHLVLVTQQSFLLPNAKVINLASKVTPISTTYTNQQLLSQHQHMLYSLDAVLRMGGLNKTAEYFLSDAQSKLSDLVDYFEEKAQEDQLANEPSLLTLAFGG